MNHNISFLFSKLLRFQPTASRQIGYLNRSFSDPIVFHCSSSFASIKDLLPSPQTVPLSSVSKSPNSTDNQSGIHIVSDDSIKTALNLKILQKRTHTFLYRTTNFSAPPIFPIILDTCYYPFLKF